MDQQESRPDPVCGMMVELASAGERSLTSTYQGCEYAFCSEECAGEFRDDPESYTVQKLNESGAMKPIRKHVLVCGGSNCAERNEGGDFLWHRLRKKLAGRRLLHGGKLPGSIRAVRTSCVGGCGHGPMVVVYPDGVFYANMAERDLDGLIDQHLLGNRVLERKYFFQAEPAEDVVVSGRSRRRVRLQHRQDE